MAKLDPVSKPFDPRAIVRGTFIALASTFVLSLAAGLVYFFTSLPEKTMAYLSAGIILFSIALGSFVAVRRAGGKGLYHGLVVGISTFVFLWIAAIVLTPAQTSFPGMMEKFSLSLLGGILGGILGAGTLS